MTFKRPSATACIGGIVPAGPLSNSSKPFIGSTARLRLPADSTPLFDDIGSDSGGAAGLVELPGAG